VFNNIPKSLVYKIPYIYWVIFVIVQSVNALFPSYHTLLTEGAVELAILIGVVLTFVIQKQVIIKENRAANDKHVKEITTIADNASSQIGQEYFDTVSDGVIQLIDCDFVMISQLSHTPKGQPYLHSHAIHNRDGKMQDIEYNVENIDLIKIAGIENRHGGELMAPPPELFPNEIKEHIASPLISSKGRIIGIMSCMWEHEINRNRIIRPVLQIYSNRCAAELERMMTESQLYYKANYDSLTKLPNRSFMINDIEEILEEIQINNIDDPDRYHVYFIDLDDFKEINDDFGHDAGDILLKEVAFRLKSCVNKSDVVARLGGDEFVIIQHRRNHYPENTADCIIEKLSQVVEINHHELSVTASVGYVAVPGDTIDATEILKYADFAMYRAKDLGKNKHVKFTKEIFDESQAERSMERQLAEAIKNREIDIVIQPVVDRGLDSLIKGEALARWNLNGEIISPEIFVELAERRGLINGLGKLIFEKSVEYIGNIKKEYGITAELCINCSTIQLKDPNFINFASDTVKAHDVGPKQITLEITETVMSDEDSLMATLVAARALGFSIAIDDFGTGYSSISFLEQLPVHIIKVDKSLVDGVGVDEKMQIVLRSILKICKVYKYQLVAEGVETKEDFNYLKSIGYDMIQGYYISKPLSPEKYTKVLRGR